MVSSKEIRLLKLLVLKLSEKELMPVNIKYEH
jgi:hypothetical protein